MPSNVSDQQDQDEINQFRQQEIVDHLNQCMEMEMDQYQQTDFLMMNLAGKNADYQSELNNALTNSQTG
jgi:hypothetical protein